MGKYDKEDDSNIKIEKYNILKDTKQIIKKNYYDKTIKILNDELDNLKSSSNKIKNDINYFKYEVFSKEIEFLKNKRYPENIEIENREEEDEKNEINNIEEEENEEKDKKNVKKSKNKSKRKKKNKKNEKDILKEIEAAKKDLEKNIEINEYKEDFINNGILINQKNVCGKTLDLGVLLGPSDNKIFIGFQMKYYEKGTHLKNPKEISKDNIKTLIKPILINCLKEFNIKIKQWHYIFCFYYNPKEKDSYNKSLENSCNEFDIEYILFDPNEEIFYSRDFNPIAKEIKLNYRSNIDCLSSTNPYLIFKNNDLLEYYANQRITGYIEFYNENIIFNIKRNIIIEKLKSALNIDFKIVYKFDYNWDFPFPTPKSNYLLFFKKKEEENNYIYIYNNDEKFICRDLNNKSYNAGAITNYIEYKENENTLFYVFTSLIE